MRGFLTVAVVALLAVVLASPASADQRLADNMPYNIKQVPWTLALLLDGEPWCGATLVDLDTALTAAHCVKDKTFRSLTISAGNSDRTKGVKVGMLAVAINSKYTVDNKDYDIAVLHLKDKLTEGPGIRPVRVASEEVPTDATVTVAGWGQEHSGGAMPKHLRGIVIPTVDRDECQTQYPMPVTTRMICAGTPDGERGACRGDSGGPMTDTDGILVALVSFGLDCLYPRSGGYGIYVNVAEPELRQWIRKQTGIQ